MNAPTSPVRDRLATPALPDPLQRHLELRIAAREAEIAALEARLSEALGRIEAERSRIAPLEQALADRFEELGTLGRLFVEAQAERERLEVLLGEERHQRGLFEEQLRAMEGSTIWRATAPVRAFLDRLRALRGRG